MKPIPSFAHRQRGVALITAVLIVALAVILATQIGFDSALEQRRATTAIGLDQAFMVGLGAEAWAATYLQEDSKQEKNSDASSDNLGEKWATPIPPIPVDGGEVEGQIEDMQGRFNLNNLVRKDGEQLVENPLAVFWFKRLLEHLKLEPKWASMIVDRLDTGNSPTQDGAEDDVYMSQLPPYRSANGPMASVSELLSLPEFGLERYRKLRPYVAALPVGTTFNVCTAPGLVLDSIVGQDQYALSEKEMVSQRKGKCFPSQDSIKGDAEQSLRSNPVAGLPVDQLNAQIKAIIGEKSNYFRAYVLVTIGTTEFSMYSLLHRTREDPYAVNPVMRSFGTE